MADEFTKAVADMVEEPIFEIDEYREADTAQHDKGGDCKVEAAVVLHNHSVAQIALQGREASVAECRDGVEEAEENLVCKVHTQRAVYRTPYNKCTYKFYAQREAEDIEQGRHKGREGV